MKNIKKIGEEGREILNQKITSFKNNIKRKPINELVNYLKLKTSLDLFYRVGIGAIENQQLRDYAAQKSNTLVNFFKKTIKRSTSVSNDKNQKNKAKEKLDLLVFGAEQSKLEYKFSPCCSPIPGDLVFGFVTINEGIKVHKMDCPNAISLQSNFAYRIVQAKWIDSLKKNLMLF
jgi:GTP diphosphokinase / guanosine-3',5'-bis(diphosphate) 3'-diphosphatase